MKGNVSRGRRSRRAAKVDPPGGFWQHSALSWHDGKQKRSKLLLGVLSTTASFSLLTKWQFFISLINSSNIILTFFGAQRPPLAAACLVCFFLTFIYIYAFWFGENRVPHSVTRFSNSFGLRFVCHRVAARNSKLKTPELRKVRNVKTKKSHPAASSREITSPPVVVVVVVLFLFDSRLRTTWTRDVKQLAT